MRKSIRTKELVEHLFRHEAGRIVSILTRLFGFDRIEIAEDVVQEALLKALQQWPYTGVPENPSGWIMQVAKRQALDILRREKSFTAKQQEIIRHLESNIEPTDAPLDDAFDDDQLGMMFACCHPSLPRESQIALTLKILCGFSTAEIARAFLSNEETVRKRIVRAKQRLRGKEAQLEIPTGKGLDHRLDTVLAGLYLLFNEGYNASHGEALIRNELCNESIRLTRLLVQHPTGNTPSAHALLALMLLHTARFPARVDEEGSILLLKDQDRSLWNKRLIAEGLRELDSSAEGNVISEYHLQAGIAACHCLAQNFETTDWQRILTLYDLLVEVNDSPIVSLNRAVAVSRVHGPEAGIRAVETIKNKSQLDKYYLLYAILGEFFFATGKFEDAAMSYRKALELTQVRSEQLFLSRQLNLIRQNMN